MFETAEIGRKMSKKDFEAMVPALRMDLIDLQQQLRQADFPVVLVFAGVDKAGKSETVNLLNEWLDPRWLLTRAYGEPSDEERERPLFWRYWRDLPPRGRIGLFLSSWYSAPVLEQVHGLSDQAAFDDALARIHAFEKPLAEDGALILKFWMHLGRDAQAERLRALEADPLTAWRVTERDWQHWELYDRFVAAAERAIRRTSRGYASWKIVEGADPRYRAATVALRLRDRLRRHLQHRRATQQIARAVDAHTSTDDDGEELPGLPTSRTILQTLDMDLSLPRKSYKKALEREQGRLAELQRKARDRGVSSVLVFEGVDAGGKGGAIRRVVRALDARDVQVVPIAAPSDEERAHHYLWRFWRHVSRAGKVTIFDRSWYGRVLVERVEGFASEAEWMRAYAEINDFEEQLHQHGTVVVKYWMHVSFEEQERRFEERRQTPFKRWKLTEEDWRNREKWGDYELAVDAMVERTSTRFAPWTLVEGNDKPHARVKVVRTFADRLERALG